MSKLADMQAFDKDPAEVVTIEPKGWTNSPDIKDLKQDLTSAQTDHDAQTAKIDGWLDNLNITGSAEIKTPKGSSKVQPKLIRKQAEWRYASLSEAFLATEDLFDITPTTWEDSNAAEQNSLVINNQFNTKIDKVNFIDTYVRTVVNEGTVIIRSGWDYEEETTTEVEPIIEFRVNPEYAQLHEELHQMMESDPTGYEHEVPEELRAAHDASMEAGQPLEPVITGSEEVEITKTIRNVPTLEVCDYRNVVIDPSCKDNLDKAQFIVYSFETSKSELEKDGDKYQNLKHVVLDNNSPLGDPDHATNNETNFNFSDDARKRIVAYEYWGYWDYDDSGIAKPFVATWIGDTLIRLEASPFPDKKLPFTVVSLLPVKNSVYGEPDGELLLDNQKIIGAITRGMIDVMGKSANGQMGIRKDALDATNKRKFQLGKNYEYNGGVDPRMAFYMHTYPEIPQSASYMLGMQNNEAESMSGVKAFNNGISSDGLGEVATGIRGALDAATKRETGILRRLAQGIAQVGRKVIAMNSEFLEDDEIIRVTNESFVAIRREDLAGEFDLKVDVSSLEEDSSKAQELAFMLQTMGNNMDPGMSQLVLRDIARLRKMPELAKKLEDFKPEPDPMQQKVQEMEIAKLQAEIEEIQSRTAENYAEAELDKAKARQLSSQADKQDLDFIEQESGVTQEREKELYGEQARSNQELEVTKHQLKARDQAGENLKAYLEQKNVS